VLEHHHRRYNYHNLIYHAEYELYLMALTLDYQVFSYSNLNLKKDLNYILYDKDGVVPNLPKSLPIICLFEGLN